MALLWNAFTLKYFYFEMLLLWNDFTMKWFYYEMILLWNAFTLKKLFLQNAFPPLCFSSKKANPWSGLSFDPLTHFDPRHMTFFGISSKDQLMSNSVIPTNIRQGWKNLPGIDTPAYYEYSKTTTVKWFITLALDDLRGSVQRLSHLGKNFKTFLLLVQSNSFCIANIC